MVRSVRRGVRGFGGGRNERRREDIGKRCRHEGSAPLAGHGVVAGDAGVEARGVWLAGSVADGRALVEEIA